MMQCSADTLYRQIILSWLRASTWFASIYNEANDEGYTNRYTKREVWSHGKRRYSHEYAANVRHKPHKPNSNTETMKPSECCGIFLGIYDGCPYCVHDHKDNRKCSGRCMYRTLRAVLCNKRHTCCSCCVTRKPQVKKHDMTQFKCARLAFGKNANSIKKRARP